MSGVDALFLVCLGAFVAVMAMGAARGCDSEERSPCENACKPFAVKECGQSMTSCDGFDGGTEFRPVTRGKN